MSKKKSGLSINKGTPATSKLIQQQTDEYLKKGGQIDVIKTGVTGLNYMKSSINITINSTKEKK